MEEIVKYPNCFVCGDNNRHGLKARFFFDGDKAFSEVVADESFEGYRGVYHGGIIAALLDEVMIKAILARNIIAVTVEMTVRYHAPVAIGDRLTFTGRITGSRRHVYFTEGDVTDSNGTVCASATGKYVEARGDFKQTLESSVE